MSHGGRTHAVRNQYGHIEYLTDTEITSLRERGEDIDVIGSYRGHPPTAKNPANQARVNELWREEQEKKQRKGSGKKKPNPLQALGTVAGLYGAVAGSGLAGGALPGHEGDVRGLSEGWKDAARMEQRDSQTRGLRRATRDKGTRDRDTGQQ